MDALEVNNVYKSFDNVPVLSGVQLRVPEGQAYGVLGPNGTGKSTLIHLLLGFLKPQRGTVRVLGTNDLERVRSRIGYLPERLRYHTRYSAREYLRYLGQFSGLGGSRLKERVEAELRAVDIVEVADRRLETYSKGMLQRVGIAQALLAEPDVLLIDEPTSGLDPSGQREMFDLLNQVRQRGHTILLTTHVLNEVDYLCDRVGILANGKMAAEADVAYLRTPGRNVTIRVGALPPELPARLLSLSPAVRCNANSVILQPNNPALQAQVLRVLLDADVPILSLEPQSRPLEELYERAVRGEDVSSALEEANPRNTYATAQLEPLHEPVDPTLFMRPPTDKAPRPQTNDPLLHELLSDNEREQ